VQLPYQGERHAIAFVQKIRPGRLWLAIDSIPARSLLQGHHDTGEQATDEHDFAGIHDGI